MTASRDAYTCEVAAALEAAGDMADDLSCEHEKYVMLEQELWAIKAERDAERGLRTQTLEASNQILVRTQNLEEELRSERNTAAAALSGRVRAETKCEMLDTQFRETTAALEKAWAAGVGLERELGALRREAQINALDVSRRAADVADLRLELNDMGRKFSEQLTLTVSAEQSVQAIERAMAVTANVQSQALSRQTTRRTLPLQPAVPAKLPDRHHPAATVEAPINGGVQTHVLSQGAMS